VADRCRVMLAVFPDLFSSPAVVAVAAPLLVPAPLVETAAAETAAVAAVVVAAPAAVVPCAVVVVTIGGTTTEMADSVDRRPGGTATLLGARWADEPAAEDDEEDAEGGFVLAFAIGGSRSVGEVTSDLCFCCRDCCDEEAVLALEVVGERSSENRFVRDDGFGLLGPPPTGLVGVEEVVDGE
jgi:hypothetical protein